MLATLLAAAAMLIGALLWFRPYLTHKQIYDSAVPTPTALTATAPTNWPPASRRA